MGPVLMYVALAYSHTDPAVVEQRVNQFLDLDAILIRNGNVTVSPISKHFILNRGMKIPGDWRYWETYSCTLLKKCDMMVICTDIEGWKESTGIRGEVQFALTLGIDIRGVDSQGRFHKNFELQQFVADCKKYM
jgi:hypothetical protein